MSGAGFSSCSSWSRSSSGSSFSIGSSFSSGSSFSRSSSSSRASSGAGPAGNPLPILRPQTNWENLYFYQKTVVLYQMTVVFCRRFLPKFGDRTVDQMVQAARSGKQNIVEGFADGVTSTEMELKLLNVARASLKELKEDYVDYLAAHRLALWDKTHPRYDALLKFCRAHNKIEEYEGFFEKWSDEELANCANTLCHMVDRMMATHLEKKAEDFKENGGIKERMTAVRLGRRQTQNEEIAALKAENARLRAEVESLKRELKAARGASGAGGSSGSSGSRNSRDSSDSSDCRDSIDSSGSSDCRASRDSIGSSDSRASRDSIDSSDSRASRDSIGSSDSRASRSSRTPRADYTDFTD